jgi:uncharacterized membrane protein/ribosomal protein L40E
MAFCDTDKLPQYRRHRILSTAKRLLVFSGITVFCTYALFTSAYISTPSAAVASAAAAGAAFYMTKLYLIFDRTWDGEVIAKEKQYTYSKTLGMMIRNPSKKLPRDKQGNVIPFVKSILTVRRSDGKIIKYTDVDDDESKTVCYYRIGDRVRHHAGLELYEKEDKTQDRRILCLRCLSLEPKENAKCRSCGFPLLK